MKKDESPQEMYERWWLGKKVVFTILKDEMKPFVVKAIELVGPPSFVYGNVILFDEQGRGRNVPVPTKFGRGAEQMRPYKKDVTVIEEGGAA